MNTFAIETMRVPDLWLKIVFCLVSLAFIIGSVACAVLAFWKGDDDHD